MEVLGQGKEAVEILLRVLIGLAVNRLTTSRHKGLVTIDSNSQLPFSTFRYVLLQVGQDISGSKGGGGVVR